MYARQSVLASPLFGKDMKKLLPIITPGGSDSAMLDNAVELLTLAGRSLPHVMSMLIPEAWDNDPDDAGGREGILRIPRIADGAVGRSGCRRLHRRASDRREARSQRTASRPLSGDRGRPRDHGLGSGRAPGEAGRRAHEGSARAGPHAAGGHGTEAPDLGRRSEEAAGGAAALRAVGEARIRSRSTIFRAPRTSSRRITKRS